MPLCTGGTLRSVIDERFTTGIKDETVMATIMYQLVQGLAYFHSKGLLHRDFKAENVLVHESGQLMLSNF